METQAQKAHIARLTETEEINQQGIGVRFDQIEDSIKQLVRRIETMQKSIDLLFADRSILEDIVTSMGQVKSMNVLNRQHQENVMKGMQEDVSTIKTAVQEVHADVKETKATVEEGMEDLGNTIDKSTEQQKNTVVLKDQTLIDKVRSAVIRK